jgi:hypothetical protein
METAFSSETLLSIYNTIRRHDPEELNLNRQFLLISKTVFCVHFLLYSHVLRVYPTTTTSCFHKKRVKEIHHILHSLFKRAAKALLFLRLKGIWDVCLTGQIEKEGFSCRD